MKTVTLEEIGLILLTDAILLCSEQDITKPNRRKDCGELKHLESFKLLIVGIAAPQCSPWSALKAKEAARGFAVYS